MEETYEEFIQNILDTRGRFACGDEYHECHHIEPRCMGGTNDEENLIDLFAREHFIAHRMLALENPDDEKLVYAWWNMCSCKKSFRQGVISTPEEYEEARVAFIRSISGSGNPNYGNHKLAGKNNPSYGKCYRNKPVYSIELDRIFVSSRDAERNTGADHSSIIKCCKHKIETCGKCKQTQELLHWLYVYDQKQKDGTVIQGAITLGYVTEERVYEYLNNLKGKGD